jgi:hypothetical protein
MCGHATPANSAQRESHTRLHVASLRPSLGAMLRLVMKNATTSGEVAPARNLLLRQRVYLSMDVDVAL